MSFLIPSTEKNTNGQLGDGTTIQRLTPIAVDTSGALKNQKIIKIAAGSAHCVCVSDFGRVFSWGNNPFGQLGDASATQRNSPVEVIIPANGISNKKIVTVSAGLHFSLALSDDGLTFAWGDNGIIFLFLIVI